MATGNLRGVLEARAARLGHQRPAQHTKASPRLGGRGRQADTDEGRPRRADRGGPRAPCRGRPRRFGRHGSARMVPRLRRAGAHRRSIQPGRRDLRSGGLRAGNPPAGQGGLRPMARRPSSGRARDQRHLLAGDAPSPEHVPEPPARHLQRSRAGERFARTHRPSGFEVASGQRRRRAGHWTRPAAESPPGA